MNGTELEELLNKGVRTRVFPGAQVAVRTADGRELVGEAGREWLPHHPPADYRGPAERGGAPIARHTLFDVASLTKPLVTASLMMLLFERGVLSIDTPVCSVLPEWGSSAGSDKVSMGHLLAHTAGLLDWMPFFESVSAGGSWEQNRDSVRRACLQAPRDRPGVHRYSDLGYIVLHWIIERVGGAPFEQLARQWLFEPAGLRHTCFGHSEEPIDVPTAATERCAFRGRVIRGEVHDENTWVMGGVSGHAGLFSCALEILTLLRTLFDGSEHTLPLIGGSTQAAVFDRGNPCVAGSHLLGWDTPSGVLSSAGTLLPRASTIGHLGFTGCSIWSDRSSGVAIVLLTNRIHPTRENERIRAYRPWFHDQIAQGLGLGSHSDESAHRSRGETHTRNGRTS